MAARREPARSHVTASTTMEHVPWDVVADGLLIFADSGSVTVTPVASSGPRFDTRSVN